MPSRTTGEISGVPPDFATNYAATASPCAIRVLENLGVDYWFGWNRPLEETCADALVSVDRVIEAICREEGAPNEDPRVWNDQSLCDLIARLCAHWERRVTLVLVSIREQAARMLDGEASRSVSETIMLASELNSRMRDHIRKSHLIAYPYIRRLENAVIRRVPFTAPQFGTLSIPLSHLSRDHEDLCARLDAMRHLSESVATGPEAVFEIEIWCDLARALSFELHQHILFEHNFLFPRALNMEASMETGGRALQKRPSRSHAKPRRSRMRSGSAGSPPRRI